MIPFIRGLAELTVIKESRKIKNKITSDENIEISFIDSAQRKRYLRSLEGKATELPDMPKNLRRKWVNNKKELSKFVDNLDYYNPTQSSYDLTLIERQNQNHKKGAA